jgi:hypothetical protein
MADYGRAASVHLQAVATGPESRARLAGLAFQAVLVGPLAEPTPAAEADVTLSTRVDIRLLANETRVLDLGTLKMPHLLEYLGLVPTGTSASQNDLLFTVSNSLTGTASYDLHAFETSAFGNTLSFAKVTTLVIRNRATSAGFNLSVGGGAGGPWATWLGASGDIVVIPPGGVFVLHSPIDGYAVTGTSSEDLQFDTGANAVAYDLFIAGRSA